LAKTFLVKGLKGQLEETAHNFETVFYKYKQILKFGKGNDENITGQYKFL